MVFQPLVDITQVVMDIRPSGRQGKRLFKGGDRRIGTPHVLEGDAQVVVGLVVISLELDRLPVHAHRFVGAGKFFAHPA
jgi:hypothetical protein